MRVSIRAPHEGAVGEATGGREVVTALQSASHQQSVLVIAVSACQSMARDPDACVGAVDWAVFCVTRPSHPGRSGDVRRGLL